jgi:hypothetical protein
VVKSDSDEELKAAPKQSKKQDNKNDDDNEWELPTFFESKNFYIYGDYSAKEIKELTRVIVGFGG